MSKYNVGDQVRIVNKRGWGWNSDGEMDKFMGKVLTISKVEDYGEINDALYTMEECPEWAWSVSDIAELVSSPADIKPTEPTKPCEPEFKVGMKVRIKGDKSDETDHLDNEVGVILEVREKDCKVEVDAIPNVFGGWLVWNYNLTPVEKAETPANHDNHTNHNTDDTKEENTMNTTTENKKVALIDTPMEFDEELAAIVANFTDDVLALADKFNTDRRDVLSLTARTITHSAEDDFFWDFIVPMQEMTKKMREKSRN